MSSSDGDRVADNFFPFGGLFLVDFFGAVAVDFRRAGIPDSICFAFFGTVNFPVYRNTDDERIGK